MSPQRRLARIRCPVVVTVGTLDTPEFQRQARDFAQALRDAGAPSDLVRGESCFHQDGMEALGCPYAFNGCAALRLIGIGPA